MSPTAVVIVCALLLLILAILYRISSQLDEIASRLDDALPKSETDEEDQSR